MNPVTQVAGNITLIRGASFYAEFRPDGLEQSYMVSRRSTTRNRFRSAYDFVAGRLYPETGGPITIDVLSYDGDIVEIP